MTTTSPIRAAIYRRVSTFRQLGGTSPETQLARARALITRTEGWEEVGDFYDGDTATMVLAYGYGPPGLDGLKGRHDG
jgi:hypothetical protein